MELIDKLFRTQNLEDSEFKILLELKDENKINNLLKKADAKRREIYGDEIYIRGLIEISNFCKNDCLYCGIRKSNNKVSRYRLNKEEIIFSATHAYNLGFRTFVIQGGEDNYFSDDILVEILTSLKSEFDDIAITLSLGERSEESYQKLYDAGANRYLLRHETATKSHYEKLHPKTMSYENRMKCLHKLRKIGYQTGCGVMIGSPYQTKENLLSDIRFIQNFRPHMVGIGPYLPHKQTPFANMSAPEPNLVLIFLAIVRLILPEVLLPATTALFTMGAGFEGLCGGCNVIMPNISPDKANDKYLLYDNKAKLKADKEFLIDLEEKVKKLGYKIAISKGDSKLSDE